MITRLLKAWHKMIPAMECAPGCHLCCEGFAPGMTKEEWYRINHPGKYSMGEAIDSCPFLGVQGCEIYHQRPVICRLFGTVARQEVEGEQMLTDLTIFCPNGMQPQAPLPLSDALSIETACTQYQLRELRRTVADFYSWHTVMGTDMELPEKFQWLQYFLSTRTGKMMLQMTRQKPELNPQEIQRAERMMAIMEGQA